MKNRDIRNAAAGNGVFLWQVADVLGIADSSFSRKLRNELSAEEKQKILAIITQLAKGGQPCRRMIHNPAAMCPSKKLKMPSGQPA